MISPPHPDPRIFDGVIRLEGPPACLALWHTDSGLEYEVEYPTMSRPDSNTYGDISGVIVWVTAIS